MITRTSRARPNTPSTASRRADTPRRHAAPSALADALLVRRLLDGDPADREAINTILVLDDNHCQLASGIFICVSQVVENASLVNPSGGLCEVLRVAPWVVRRQDKENILVELSPPVAPRAREAIGDVSVRRASPPAVAMPLTPHWSSTSRS